MESRERESVIKRFSRDHFDLASDRYSTRKPVVTLEQLAARWGVGIQTTKDTIQATTQVGAISAMNPLYWRYWKDKHQFRYNILETTMYTDILLAGDKYLIGNTYGHILTTRFVYLMFMLLINKGDPVLAFLEVLQEVGLPTGIHAENARDLDLDFLKEICQRHRGINTTTADHHFLC